jgi:hypothetical protein
MNKLKSLFVSGMAGLLILSSTACSPASSPVAVLAAVEAFAEAAVSDLASSGVIGTAAGTTISNDLTLVVAAIDKTASEEASTDSAAVKASKIVLLWANVALDPAAVKLLPLPVQISLNALSAGIKALLAYFQAMQPAITSHAVAADKMAKPSLSDLRKLNSIRSGCGKMLKTLTK